MSYDTNIEDIYGLKKNHELNWTYDFKFRNIYIYYIYLITSKCIIKTNKYKHINEYFLT